MKTKNRIVIFYEFFYPAYRAGGPIQSIHNMCNVLDGDFEIFIICSNKDIDGSLLTGVVLNNWNTLGDIKVFYLQKQQRSIYFIKNLLNSINPNVIYVNGVFSIPFSIFPIVLSKMFFKHRVKTMVAPRGMLQKGALENKSFKKNIFLSTFKTIGLYKRVIWHATDDQEADDIKTIFGSAAIVRIVSNIPKPPIAATAYISKVPGELKLVFISLIAKKKNLRFAIECLKGLSIKVTFDIYGPIKDKLYWDECLEDISTASPNLSIRYLGDLLPLSVQEKFSDYHAFFLPTHGENFGHAIYESLSVGRPVIISKNTPWKNLEMQRAGFDIALGDQENFNKAIQNLHRMDEVEYAQWCSGALNVAKEFYARHDFKKEYTQLFE